MSSVYSQNGGAAGVQPIGSLVIRDAILQCYLNGINDVAALKRWMLKPSGSRGGNLKMLFNPFFEDFTRLYLISTNIPILRTYEKVTEKGGLAERIDKWMQVSRQIYRLNNPKNRTRRDMQAVDEIINQGIKLFTEWSQVLNDKAIVEFR